MEQEPGQACTTFRARFQDLAGIGASERAVEWTRASMRQIVAAEHPYGTRNRWETRFTPSTVLQGQQALAVGLRRFDVGAIAHAFMHQDSGYVRSAAALARELAAVKRRKTR